MLGVGTAGSGSPAPCRDTSSCTKLASCIIPLECGPERGYQAHSWIVGVRPRFTSSARSEPSDGAPRSRERPPRSGMTTPKGWTSFWIQESFKRFFLDKCNLQLTSCEDGSWAPRETWLRCWRGSLSTHSPQVDGTRTECPPPK